jgi:hypothetical protein
MDGRDVASRGCVVGHFVNEFDGEAPRRWRWRRIPTAKQQGCNCRDSRAGASFSQFLSKMVT